MVNRGVQLPPFYTGEGQRPAVSQAMVPEEYYGNPAAQAGVDYIPDATDIYGEDGPLAGAFSPAGVEMVGAGFEPAQG